MFEIGKVYNKTQLHEQFGAQEIKSMVIKKNFSPIIIVTGDERKICGDNGEWISDDTYVYTDHLLKSRLNLNPDCKEHVIDDGHVYLFKHINEDKVEFANKFKGVRLKIETGYDEDGSYTERIRYEFKK